MRFLQRLRKQSDQQQYSAEALNSWLDGVKNQVSVNEQHWSVMYQPMFDKLLLTGKFFKGKEYELYKKACKELPRLIRYSKKKVSRDISEQPLKIYLTTLAYVTLLIVSAFRRFEVVSVNSKQQRFSVYPWHETELLSDLRVSRRKVVTSSAPFAGEVVHWLVTDVSIWRWLYNEPDWLAGLYREVISGGDAGMLLGQGVVYFDNPFPENEEHAFPKNADEPSEVAEAKSEQPVEESPPEGEASSDEHSLLDSPPEDDMDLDQLIEEEVNKKRGEAPEKLPSTSTDSLDVHQEFETFMSSRKN